MNKQESNPNELTVYTAIDPDADPYEVIKEFFLAFHLDDAIETSWAMLRASVCSDYFEEPMDRDNLFYFFDNICSLVAAAEKIHKANLKKGKRENNSLYPKSSNL